jgi:hypothetical protein
MTSIFRWNGTYFGFLSGPYLFDAGANYLGWRSEDGKVWRHDGSFLGEIVDEHYILRKAGASPPSNRSARSRPSTPSTPSRTSSRSARSARSGWTDALNEYPDV